jgi:Putative beta-barrel porin-2, OmpL-like. bbp2
MFSPLLFTIVFSVGQSGSSALQPPVPLEEPKASDGKSYRVFDDGRPTFLHELYKAYRNEFFPKPKEKENGGENGNGSEEPETPRRALPSPWSSPPFPGSEYQGYPLIGVPASTSNYPFMKAFYASTEGTHFGDAVKDSRIKFDGWATASGTWSTARQSNVPASYWIVPNSYQLDQMLFRVQRELNTVQTDHIDWGFRSVVIYGMDYRYTTAGGWFSRQLLANNNLYGWDPAEQYFDVYIPFIGQGAVLRVGRWIACPDIETQWAPDNYLGSHSLLFTVDTYTQTGLMWSQRISEQLMVQAAIHAGTDMAPWYPGAIPTGAFGVRWVAQDNNNAFYGWLNAINNAEFRHFTQYGQPLGHDNFNYAVVTWEHRFNKDIHTKTEGYYMWERNAEVGGTPSAGPVEPFGGGGGDGALIPGLSRAYGVLNYTAFSLSKMDYVTVRNEWYHDETGFRLGKPGNYTSHTIGISHYFNDVFLVRPEIGYYRNWNNPTFDNGTKHGITLYGFDMTIRF